MTLLPEQWRFSSQYFIVATQDVQAPGFVTATSKLVPMYTIGLRNEKPEFASVCQC
jgi:hypothetical protein